MITTALLFVLAMAFCPDTARRHERILRTAIAKSGQTVQQAAAEAEISQAQFTKQLQLLEGSHKRLAMQPVEFWRWYAVEITREFGLPEELETAGRLQRAVRYTDSESEMEMAS